MRLPGKVLDRLKEKYDVDRIWSFSRLNSYLQYPWEYRMNYLEKKPRSSNVYSHFGTISHDIIQDMYDGKHSYEDMIGIFDEKVAEWEMKVSSGEKHLQFIKESTEKNYISSLRHYFQNTEVVEYKLRNETAVILVLKDDVTKENVVFIGYVDSEYTDDDGILNIVDYKTSSKGDFGGAKLKEKSKQLKIYAIAISQFRGIPVEKIRMRFDMMKYVEVKYLQKNGKWRGFPKERHIWVQGMEKKIYAALVDDNLGGLDPFEAEEVLELAVLNNSIEDLPKIVQEQFEINNYYVDVTIDNEEAEELRDEIVETVREIKAKEKGDWEIEFPEPVIDFKNKFYFTVLAPQLLKYHKGWQEQQELLKGTSNNPNEVLSEFFE